MNCPNRHHAVRENARFCDYCGAPIVDNPEALTETLLSDPLIGRVLDSRYELLELRYIIEANSFSAKDVISLCSANTSRHGSGTPLAP